jgi:hypothetical protein
MTAQSDGGFFRTPAVDFGEHRRAVAVAYSSKATDQLRGSNLALAEISKKALTAYLREAGAIYLDQKTRITKERQALPDTNAKRRHKAQLQGLAKTARQLNLQMAQLEKPAADLLWLPISDQVSASTVRRRPRRSAPLSWINISISDACSICTAAWTSCCMVAPSLEHSSSTA